MRKILPILTLMLVAAIGWSQGTITGKVLDEESGAPLIGVTVVLKGTYLGTVTDFDGAFKLENLPQGQGTLEFAFLGYESRDLSLNISEFNDLGNLMLTVTSEGLEEVVVTGTMDIVRDRRTPVAISTISSAEIQSQSGNVEFPELMKNTPSIYVANQAGGYGDAQVFTRGFDQTNTAFLLNGQPINGMEDGKMYWSNWSGMADVASAIQVQRGLGSSKLAISSVGGTTNIIMKSTGRNPAGSVRFLVGNDNYFKTTFSFDSGMKGKWGISGLLTHWQGDGWAEGTKGQGQNYFISVGFKPNDRHNLNFLVTGAPQWHDQNYTKRLSSYYNNPDKPDELNEKFNSNYGYLANEYYSLRRNYYHKPVANLNWDFKINERSSFSTVLYGSWGRGGGSGDIGNRNNRFYTEDGYIDWDAVHAANVTDAGDEEWVLRNSVNNHAWYGAVLNYNTRFSDFWDFSIGADFRTYHGSHFRELRSLMGAPAYTQRANARFGEREVTNTFKANPWKALTDYADEEDQIAYSNDERIGYQGLFSQIEYQNDRFTWFFQGAISNQSNVRFEKFNATEQEEESDKVTNFGYNVKTGLSYEITSEHMLFANTGYYQRQPFQDNIFLNFSNTVSTFTVPEKIFGLELGYRLSLNNFNLSINGYRTSWEDHATTDPLRTGDDLPSGAVMTTDGNKNSIQDQLHSGFEIDFAWQAIEALRIKGYTSFGNWVYKGESYSRYFDEDQNLLEDIRADVDGVKVGGAAQTTFGLGLDWNAFENFTVGIDYNYYNNLYSSVDAVSNTSLKLPSFGIMDLGLGYRFDVGNGNMLSLRSNIYNVFNELYISRSTSADEASTNATENWNGVNKSNFVIFGKTRTWNLSLRYDF